MLPAAAATCMCTLEALSRVQGAELCRLRGVAADKRCPPPAVVVLVSLLAAMLRRHCQRKPRLHKCVGIHWKGGALDGCMLVQSASGILAQQLGLKAEVTPVAPCVSALTQQQQHLCSSQEQGPSIHTCDTVLTVAVAASCRACCALLSAAPVCV